MKYAAYVTLGNSNLAHYLMDDNRSLSTERYAFANGKMFDTYAQAAQAVDKLNAERSDITGVTIFPVDE